jgi:hypothetical protein
MAVIPQPPSSPDLAPRNFFLFPKMKMNLKGRRLGTIEQMQAKSESVLITNRKGLPRSVPKMEETVGPVSTCGRELLQGWWWPIGLMVSFMIFTASVRNILDRASYTSWIIKSSFNTRNCIPPQDETNVWNMSHLLNFYEYCMLQWCTKEGRGGFGVFKPRPSKFQSFDKAEPNFEFRGKYIHNKYGFHSFLNWAEPQTRDYCPQISVPYALCPQLNLHVCVRSNGSGGATNSKFKSKLMSVILMIIDEQYQKQTCETEDHFIKELLITWYNKCRPLVNNI